MFANRNGFYYTLDRTNGKVIVAKPFVTTTWAKEIGARRPAGAAARPHAGREGRGHLPRHHRRHQLLAADVTIRRTRTVLRQRARSVHDLLRVEAGVQAGRALHGRRRPARARARHARCTARCARSIRRPASGSGSSSYLTPVDGGPADDRVGPDLQRRRRRQPAGARLAQRQAALALPDGRQPARHVADHLHARRPPARARARGHDADRLGAAAVNRRLSSPRAQRA